MAVSQVVRRPAVDLRDAELTPQAPQARSESGRQSTTIPAGDSVSVMGRFGPFQLAELDSLMQELLAR